VSQLLTCPEDVVTHLSGDICVLRLQGSLSRTSASRIDGITDQLQRAACSSVLVDASLLGQINEDCLNALRSLWRAMKRKGVQIVTYGATGAIAGTLESLALS
jgi:anti-anti-sigma regulatory factor